MTLQQLINSIFEQRGPIALTIVAMMTLIQISPIKVNPWSYLFKWLGRQINSEVMKKINEVEKRLDEHIKNSLDAELKARRAAILDFSSSVIRGTNYHREKFAFMIRECDAYETYCRENNIVNGVANASIAEIRRIYQEHLRNQDFLMESGIDDDKEDVQ